MTSNIKKDYLWNTLGTATFSLVSLLLSILVIRIVGKVDGGIFTFGFTAFSSQILTITAFGVKTIQAIDVSRKYSFKEYKIHRITTVVISLIIGIVYLMILCKSGTYDFIKSVIIFVLMFHAIIEGYFDVYEAEFQRQHLLYKAGFALFVRSIGWALVFIVVLYVTKNLLISAIIGMCVKFYLGYIYETKKSKHLFIDESDIKVNVMKTIKDITIEILPIFLMVFLDNFIYMISKFAIDFYLGDIETGFYNFIFLPANALYLLQYLVSRPLLTPLSELYNNDYVEYKKRANKIVFYSIFVCVGLMLSGVVFSGLYLDIVNVITNNMYIDFNNGSRMLLFNILLGGGFYAFYVMLYYMLVIERQKNRMLIVYIVLSVVALLLSTVLTGSYGLFGASLSFAIIMFMLSMILMILHFVALRSKR